MTEKISNIARNTSYFTLALILQKIISFTYFTIIARALGPADLGKYYFAIAFTTIFAIIIDLGLANVLTREVARSKEQTEKLLGNILTIKIPLVVLSWGLVFMVINWLGYPVITKQLVYLSSICMILDSFTATFFAVSRGWHNLFFESIASVIFQLIVLITGLAVLKLNLGLAWLMTSLIAASIFNFLFSFCLLWFKWRIKPRPSFNAILFKTIIKISIPFALFFIFQRIYTYLDSVLLSIMAGDEYVGYYQVAFKIIFALQFLPAAFTASLYPAMSAYWASNRGQLAITFERAMSYLIIISLPIAIGIASIADKVILLFKSGFDQSILPIQINMAALLFMFVAYPIGSLLNACDKQTVNTINMGITVLASIILNILLIPKWQAVGASLTVAITSCLTFFLGLIWVPKIIKYRPKIITLIFIKSVIASLIMSLVIFYLKSLLNVFLVVTIAGLIYFILLFIFKAFRKEDIVSIFHSFLKKNAE